MRLLILLVLLTASACSSSPVPKGIIPPTQMELVVGDVIKVDEYINNFLLKDTTLDIKKKRSVLYDKVFLLHHTTRQQFFSSFKYYKQHPDLQKQVFDSLYNHLNKKKPGDDKTKGGVIKPVAITTSTMLLGQLS